MSARDPFTPEQRARVDKIMATAVVQDALTPAPTFRDLALGAVQDGAHEVDPANPYEFARRTYAPRDEITVEVIR